MKKILIAILAAGAVLVLAGCGRGGRHYSYNSYDCGPAYVVDRGFYGRSYRDYDRGFYEGRGPGWFGGDRGFFHFGDRRGFGFGERRGGRR